MTEEQLNKEFQKEFKEASKGANKVTLNTLKAVKAICKAFYKRGFLKGLETKG